MTEHSLRFYQGASGAGLTWISTARAPGSTGNPETRKSRAASRRYEASAAFAAIVAWAHQTSSSKADFVAVAELVEEGIEAERVSREQLRQSSWGLDSVEEDALADIVHGN
jgi:hypothetical protein